MKLPNSIAPWAAQLTAFAPEVAQSLGPLLAHLGAAIGPFRRSLHAGDGQVDGFDGLTRRGSYERLLMSEWLLADEIPEEFVRRAAAAEHTFLRLARPEEIGSKSSTALFDAGPEQLGGPRIAHIASLIVLARRAAAAGASFSWGILQDRDRTAFESVSAAALKRLLAARTAEQATEADVRRWLERIGHPRTVDDVWVIGSRRLVSNPAARAVFTIEVRDLLEPRRRSLAVVVRARKQVTEVRLELPSDAAGVRLLRDPFAAASSRPRAATTQPGSNLVFSANGYRVLARARPDEILEYLVPNAPRRAVTGPTLRPLPDRVLAAGRWGRRFLAVTQAGPGLALRGMSTGFVPNQILSGYRPPSDAPLQACYLLWPQHSDPEVVFLDGTGNLLRLTPGSGRATAGRVAATGVFAIQPTDDGVLFVERTSTGTALNRLTHDASVSLPLEAEGATFLGFGGSAADPVWGLLAVEESVRLFQVRHAAGTTRIRLPADCSVVGVTRNIRRREPGLLALESDRRGLIQIGQSWTRRLPPEKEEIVSAALSPAAADVAYATASGDVVIYSLDSEVVLQRYVFAASAVS